MKVVSVYSNFANRGGAQDVALQLAEKLNNESRPMVLTETRFADIIPEYWERAKFLSLNWKNVRELANENTLFLSHHRKCTTLLLLFNQLMGRKLHIIHIAHNTFKNLRTFSFFPKTVIAVSNGVKKNLVDYFHVPAEHIQVIFNGMEDYRNALNMKTNKDEIHILMAGRICPVKQQVELVRRTKRKLAPHIHIYFAGVGKDTDLLINEIKGTSQYHYIGFTNIEKKINLYDYVCMFSIKEGLPLSLIEGCMFGKPLITNELPTVLDVNKAGETGFVFPDFTSLVKGLNRLPMPGSEEYQRLSRNARLCYERFFTEENMLLKYKQIIAKEMKHSVIPQPTPD